MEQNKKYSISTIGDLESGNYENIDVELHFENGMHFIATFILRSYVNRIMDEGKEYFWTSDMIIVDELSFDIFKQTIDDLFKEHYFYYAFLPCNELAAKVKYEHIGNPFEF
ncbi:MAG: hypothetical protein ACPGJS_20180 [Flammeovirgaceae bacterium]